VLELRDTLVGNTERESLIAVQIDKRPGQNQTGQAHPVRRGGLEKLTDPAWAWAAYQPDARWPWNLAQAGHLYRRAAFGAGWDQLQQALSDGPQRAVSKLLKPQADTRKIQPGV
jgi:hypothetical protein